MMMRSKALAGVVVASASFLSGPLLAQDSGAPKGVNPKDVVTKVDVIARRDSFTGGIALNSLTAKYDVGLDTKWALAIEVPLARFSAPGISESGLAESKIKLRRVEDTPWGAWLASAEFVVPTNSKASLGSDKWQANPGFGAVFSLTPSVFLFAGYQHFWSIAGKSAAATINQSQPRILLARTSPEGWWLMGDFKLTFDHRANTKTFDAELEAGTMVAQDWAVSARLIESGLDSNRKWGVVAVVRHLF